MSKRLWYLSSVVVVALLLSPGAWAAHDVTKPGDKIIAIPNDGDWPGNEAVDQAIDDQTATKYLHFKGDTQPVGLRVTPSVGPTVVTGLRFCSANDTSGYPGRAPAKYELSGSNDSIDGPYTLIAAGDIKDFAGASYTWPDFTWTTTALTFPNAVAYEHYELILSGRGLLGLSANSDSVQIAEIELLETVLKAYDPSPAVGEIMTAQVFSWNRGDTATSYSIYIGTTPDLTEADRKATKTTTQARIQYPYTGYLEPGVLFYWRVDQKDKAGTITGDVWSAIAPPTKAYGPVPRDGDKWIPVVTQLSWQAGLDAESHDVYFGTDKQAVMDRSASVHQSQTTDSFFALPELAENTTYYWAVDETTLLEEHFAGDVWSFTTLGPGGGIRGDYFANMNLFGAPVVSRIDAEVNVNLAASTSPDPAIPVGGWSARWTADLDIAIADTYTFSIRCWRGTRLWIDDQLVIDKWVSGTVPSEYFALPMRLERGIHSLRVEFFTDGTDNGGSAIAQMYWLTPTMTKVIVPAGPLQPPLRARATYPGTGMVDVAQDVVLSWGAGEKAVQHVVYFGTDKDAVAQATPDSAGIYQGVQNKDELTFKPGRLEWGKTYYWRIDEVNETAADSPWNGGVWSFTTLAAYGAVDDFESYNDTDYAIFDNWRDNYNPQVIVQQGATVGNPITPYAETRAGFVHSGRQAMPLSYNNAGPYAAASETVRTFDEPWDWTANGIKSLSLWFQGTAGNTGQLYLKINSTKVPYNGNASDLAKPMWTPWNIDLSTVAGANLAKVTSMSIGVEGAGAQGKLYLDDIRIYPKTPELITPVDPGRTNLVGLWTLDGNANDTSGKGNNGTINGSQNWVSGMVGQALQFDGVSTYVDCGSGASLNLADSVTICAWIKMDGTGVDGKIAGNQDNTTGGYKLGVFTNDKVEFEIRTATGAGTLNRNSAGGTVLQQGAWYHVAGVYSKGQFIRTYVYGNLDREVITTAVLGTSTGTFKIGCEPYNAPASAWPGVMDEVQVYNRALTPEEILWLSGQKTPVAKPF